MKNTFAKPELLMDVPAFEPVQSHNLSRWFDLVFLNKNTPSPKASFSDLKEGWGELRLGSSVIGSSIKIGSRNFAKGLGVHAVSEVRVHLPLGASLFTAQAGIDSNQQNNGRGSAIFAIEAQDGKELFRSGVLRNGDEPLPISIPLDGLDSITLKVLDAGNGTSWAHSDWADAKILLKDGSEVLFDGKESFQKELPFSFLCDGKSSRSFLSSWSRSVSSEELDGFSRHTLKFLDPASGLELRCEALKFKRHPAVEWVLYLKNNGAADSPLLEAINPLDLALCGGKEPAILHHSFGSACVETDFLPMESKLKAPATQISLAPNGGRSSDSALPFFNLEWNGQGMVFGIGWSGQWAAQVQRDGACVTVTAGQETSHFKLRPGEEVRTPRIAILNWEGSSWIDGCNLFRKLVLDHYTPRIDGKLPIPPVTENTWFIFNQGNEVTEENQKALMPAMKKAGIEGYWLDAGWFEGGWPAGAGSWVPKKEAFPNGLKPLGDEAHRLGMKFVLWFEPERVTLASRVFKEHPEWVMQLKPGSSAGGEFGCLFRLGDDNARKWITDYLSKCISDWGIDVLRIDFNISPLPFWNDADAPDRQGISEIRYIENFYKMWDELRAKHPGLTIDNCASGGRRIDLETIARSYPLWQSDTQCNGSEKPLWNQVQNAGLSLYVPLHAGGLWDFDAYSFRSMATMGCSVCRDISKDNKLAAAARKAIEEVKSLRPCYLGNYYPLFDISHNDRAWSGWQFDRPDLGEGFAILFRRPKAPFTSAQMPLQGLSSAANYEIHFEDSGKTLSMPGSKILEEGVEVEMRESPSCVLLRYCKTK